MISSFLYSRCCIYLLITFLNLLFMHLVLLWLLYNFCIGALSSTYSFRPIFSTNWRYSLERHFMLIYIIKGIMFFIYIVLLNNLFISNQFYFLFIIIWRTTFTKLRKSIKITLNHITISRFLGIKYSIRWTIIKIISILRSRSVI